MTHQETRHVFTMKIYDLLFELDFISGHLHWTHRDEDMAENMNYVFVSYHAVWWPMLMSKNAENLISSGTHE